MADAGWDREGGSAHARTGYRAANVCPCNHRKNRERRGRQKPEWLEPAGLGEGLLRVSLTVGVEVGRGGGMDQWVTVPADKPPDPSSIPETHTGKGENRPPQVL